MERLLKRRRPGGRLARAGPWEWPSFQKSTDWQLQSHRRAAKVGTIGLTGPGTPGTSARAATRTFLPIQLRFAGSQERRSELAMSQTMSQTMSPMRPAPSRASGSVQRRESWAWGARRARINAKRSRQKALGKG